MKFIIIKDDMVKEIEQWLELLDSRGSRVTGPRRLIVELMITTDRALSPIDLFDLARKHYPKMGLTTVYRTLDMLEDMGMVQRVHHTAGCNLYLKAAKGHEHIMLCTCCGRAVYFCGDDLGGLFQKTGSESGFLIQNHWLQINGLCKTCQGKTSNVPPVVTAGE
jgi:Fur family ferric uptake transcriptional regulator